MRQSQRATTKNWKPIYGSVLILTQKGWETGKIAQKVGLSPQTISAIKGSDEFKKRLENLDHRVLSVAVEKIANSEAVDAARTVLVGASIRASKVIRRIATGKLLDSDNVLRFQACKDILDRVGLQAKQFTVTQENKYNYSPAEVESAAKTLREMEHLSGRLSSSTGKFIMDGQTQRITLKTTGGDVNGLQQENKREEEVEEPAS